MIKVKEGYSINDKDSKETFFLTDNGIKVFIKNIPDSKTINCNIKFNSGAAYEKPNESGLSHFMEHMLAANTNEYRLQDFRKKYNCRHNLLTSNDEIRVLFENVSRDKFEEGFKVLSKTIFNQAFYNKDIERERKVILTEEVMGKRAYIPNHNDAYRKTLIKNSSLSKSPIGTIKNIKNFKRNDLLKFYNTFIVPENTTIIISGNITDREVQEILEGNDFGYMSCKTNPDNLKELYSRIDNFEKEKENLTNNIINSPTFHYEIDENYKEQHSSFISIGLDSDQPLNSKNRGLSDILNNLLHKRLYKRLREERGVSYGTYNYIRLLPNNKNYRQVLEEKIESKNISGYFNGIADVFAGILQRDISNEEIEEIKNNIFENHNKLEDNGRMYQFTNFKSRIKEKSNYIVPRNTRLKDIENITKEDVVKHLLFLLLFHPKFFMYGEEFKGKLNENEIINMFDPVNLQSRKIGQNNNIYKQKIGYWTGKILEDREFEHSKINAPIISY